MRGIPRRGTIQQNSMLLVRIAKGSSRLSETLHAAQSTDFYRSWLRSLDDDPEHTLDLLPHIDIGHFEEAPDRFRSARRKRLQAAFIYPIQPAPRITVFADGFRRAPNLRILTKWTPRDLGRL